MRSFREILEAVKGSGRKRVAVAVAHDIDVLESLKLAVENDLAEPLLFGDQTRIEAIASDINFPLAQFQIEHITDDSAAALAAVRAVSEGKAEAVMKGLVTTATLLKAVLNRECGLRRGRLLSHVGYFELKAVGRSILLTDAAINIAPDVAAKRQIIENAVEVAHLLGQPDPVVGCLCALETVNPAMPATLDAAALVELYQQGEMTDCRVGGPYALDNALFVEAARHKGMDDPLAGTCDILLVPRIESGNILHKSFSMVAQAPNGGLVVGAKAPLIMSSRAESEQIKLNSIALALYLAQAAEGKIV